MNKQIIPNLIPSLFSLLCVIITSFPHHISQISDFCSMNVHLLNQEYKSFNHIMISIRKFNPRPYLLVKSSSYSTMSSFKGLKPGIHMDPCTCSLFSLPTTTGKMVLAKLLSFLQSSDFMDFNPTLIVLMSTEKVNTEPALLQKFYQSLKFIHITSKWIFINGSNSVSLLCLHCLHSIKDLNDNTNTNNYSELSEKNFVQKVHKLWISLSKNLSLVQIVTKHRQLKYYEGIYPALCVDRNLFLGDERLCIVTLISEKLNFQLKYDPIIPNIYTNASQSFLITENESQLQSDKMDGLRFFGEIENWQAIGLIKTYEAQRHIIRYSWLSGWMIDPLKFLLFLDKRTLNSSALLRPYDKITWLLIGITIPLVSIVLSISFAEFNRAQCQQSTTNKVTMVGQMFFMVLGSIFEQNPNERKARKVITSFRILFGLWLLVSLILSNGYNGIIISFLCSTILPSNLPFNFESLSKVLNSYPVLSSDEIFVPGLNKSFHYSEALIYEYLLADHYDGKVKSYYMKIAQATFYITGVSRNKLLFALEEEIPFPKTKVRTEASTTLGQTTIDHYWSIPSDFAFCSTKAGVINWIDMLKKMENWKSKLLLWIPSDSWDEVVKVTTAFTLTRTSLSHLIGRYLSHIIESGLPQVWSRKQRELAIKIEWKKYQGCKEAWRQIRESNTGQKIEDFWNESTCTSENVIQKTKEETPHHGKPLASYSSSEQESSLGLNTLLSIFIVFFMGLGITIIVFVLELLPSLGKECLWKGKRYFSRFEKDKKKTRNQGKIFLKK